MERRLNSKSKVNIRQLVIVGMLSSISIFLGITRLGFIAIPPVNATIMHVPVIIGAIIEGPVVGGLVGACFGLFSMYNAYTAPTPTSFIFYNPLIAILPRVLIGVISYYVFKFLKNLFKSKYMSLNITISAIIGTLANTVGVLLLTYLIYVESFANALHIQKETAGKAIALIGVTNGIPEAIISAVIIVPIVLATFRMKK